MRALRDGSVRSDVVEFDFVNFAAVGKSFKGMIADQRYDVCEMALVAFLQAYSQSSPLRILPVVALGGFLFGNIYRDASSVSLSPYQLSDKRIGVRSYSQTTAVWLRAGLSEQFGLDVEKAVWVANGSAHVSGVKDPPNVEHVEASRSLEDLLRDRVVDAVILHPNQRPTTKVRALIAEPGKAADEWFDRHGVVPVNHVICLAPSVWREPQLVAEVFSMFRRSYRLAGVPDASDRNPLSYDRGQVGRAFELAVELAVDQKLIPSPVDSSDAMVCP